MLLSILITATFLTATTCITHVDLLDLGILNSGLFQETNDPTVHVLAFLKESLERGLLVYLPNKKVLKVGTVSVPFDTLCKTSLLEPNICRICMLDCKFAHNATSGRCDNHPSHTDETTCFCDYTRERPLPTVSSICSSYSINLVQLEIFDQQIDSLVAGFLRERYQLLLSPILKLSSGCNSDCVSNHGANKGICKDGYCLCEY